MTLTLKHPLSSSEREQLAAALRARGPDTTAGLRASLGTFRYAEERDARGRLTGRVVIQDPAWTRANIVEIDVARELPGWPVNSVTRQPQRKLYVHRVMRLPLLLAWREVCARGLQRRLHTYDGCWVPRHKLYDTRTPLSVHSWAAAIDVDAATNGFGVTPVIDPEIVMVFELFSFVSGTRWRPADGMHLQFTLPLPGTAVPAWQDGALTASSTPVAPRPAPTPKPSAPPVQAPPSRPPTVRIPRVFLRARGGDGNEAMDAKTVHYGDGEGSVTRLADGRLRFDNFTGELGLYPDQAVQLDRAPEETS